MVFMPWIRESDLNAFGGAASLVCFNRVFALVVTHSSNKYLSRRNASITFGPQQSSLLASHVLHCLLTRCLPWLGSIRVPPATSQLFVRLHQVHWPPELGEGASPTCQPFTGKQFEALSTEQCYIWCDVMLQALGEPDKRLSQTLAWHHFNYSPGQCRAVPAKAIACLAPHRCSSDRKRL